MNGLSRAVTERKTGIIVIAVLCGVYIACLSEFGLGRTPTDSLTAGQATQVDLASTGDVPDSVVNDIVNHVGGISGLEVVVLPGNIPNHYEVSAEVQLPGTVESSAEQQSSVNDMLNRFFRGVYGSGVNVENARMFFSLDGKLVGGAGLGPDAYHRLDVSASTTDDDVVSWLQSQPVQTDDGPNDSWYQYGVANDVLDDTQ